MSTARAKSHNDRTNPSGQCERLSMKEGGYGIFLVLILRFLPVPASFGLPFCYISRLRFDSTPVCELPGHSYGFLSYSYATFGPGSVPLSVQQATFTCSRRTRFRSSPWKAGALRVKHINKILDDLAIVYLHHTRAKCPPR